MHFTYARNFTRRSTLTLVFAMLATFAVPTAGYAQLEDLRAWMAHESGIVGVRLVQQGEHRGQRMLETAALAGDVTAQYNLGLAYAKGYIGGRSQPVEALRWYRRAADAGHAAAAYNAGALYANGAFGEEDLSRASPWMHLAAQRQHAGAVRWLERVAVH